MSDRMYSEIRIGGKVSPEDHERLVHFLDERCNETEDCDYGGCLTARMMEAEEDAWAGIATLCRELGLSYDIRWEAKWEHEGIIFAWRHKSVHHTSYCLQDGTQTFSIEDLECHPEMTVKEFLAANVIPELPAYEVISSCPSGLQ